MQKKQPAWSQQCCADGQSGRKIRPRQSNTCKKNSPPGRNNVAQTVRAAGRGASCEARESPRGPEAAPKWNSSEQPVEPRAACAGA
ncbi:MAG: hypothetical protein [Microviridae sp.]|nr:MAG: hypothetical protein [Microviridae sp.]